MQVQLVLQEVPATSKQVTNELMCLQEEFHKQLKVATGMFSVDRGSESESDNSDSDYDKWSTAFIWRKTNIYIAHYTWFVL